MTRRFPPNPTQTLGYEGTPMLMLGVAFAAILGTAYILRVSQTESNVEISKRHHPKGVGFTGINKQIDKLHNKVKKFNPKIDENFYEYSRMNQYKSRKR